jgi:predicted TIM-barrel fold metal-dependent hydrolase
MKQTGLDFTPAVPVFDANMALGRRHNRRQSVDAAADTLAEMNRVGVDRALVYSPHAAAYDSREGNGQLLELIGDNTRIVPQFVCNPTFDNLDEVDAGLKQHGLRSIRLLPAVHKYPFRDWVVRPWLEWAAAECIPIWMPVNYGIPVRRGELDAVQLNPEAVHDTLVAHPDVKVVLCEAQIRHVPWVVPLLRSVPSIYMDLSRFVITEGVALLLETIGVERMLYGSRFPDSPMAAQLYSLHQCGLSAEHLQAICAGNLERLLSGG